MPEVLSELRIQMAAILRQKADEEVSAYVAERMREAATEFELGEGGGAEVGERRRS